MARNREGVLNGVVKIQALVRGYIVRKQFMKLRKEYVDLVICLEDDVLQVTWKSKDKLCFPSYVCLKGKTRCEKVADNVDKEDVDITLNSVSLGNTCPKITQSNSATTTEHCKSKGEYLPEKTPKENQGIKKLENDLDLLEKCPTYNPPPVATDVDGEHTVDNGESSMYTSLESCRDVRKLQEEISPSNDDARPQEMTGISKIGLQAMFQVPVTMYPKDRTELLKLREDLAMELLWIQQAIESRESYLIMKKQLEEKAVNQT